MRMVPPVTVRSPLESSPSPSALMEMVPPEIVREQEEAELGTLLVPSAALMPSSVARMEISPPEISTAAPSIPS